jgi:eukaryotic-like serine/threonine-protein kinase
VIGVGDVVAGKYRVERTLGRGGMGYVVAAQHTQLDQPVAIKVLAPELALRSDSVARFLREARAAARIGNEHVARVMDVDTLPDGTPYMVMERLFGNDLRTELAVNGRLSAAEATDYVLQACEALAEAHSYGIVHRDLKPANLFLTTGTDGAPLIKVLDFGISKAAALDGETPAEALTDTQAVIGSPPYMSPEQARAPRSVDTRTDVWALGVILYELVTGETPFVGATPIAVLANVVSEPPPSPRELCPDLPHGFESVILHCLEKNPARRFAQVTDLARALEPYLPNAGSRIARINSIARGPARSGREEGRTPVPFSQDTQLAGPGDRFVPTTLSASDRDTRRTRPLPFGRPDPSVSPASARTKAAAVLAALALLALVAAAVHWSGRTQTLPAKGETQPSMAAVRSQPREEPLPRLDPATAPALAPTLDASVRGAPQHSGAPIAGTPRPVSRRRAAAPEQAPAVAPPPSTSPSPAAPADPLDGRY